VKGDIECWYLSRPGFEKENAATREKIMLKKKKSDIASEAPGEALKGTKGNKV